MSVPAVARKWNSSEAPVQRTLGKSIGDEHAARAISRSLASHAGSRALDSQGVRPCERVEKGLCSLQISRVDAFGEAVVDRMEERHGISGTALIAQQLGEARSGGSSQERAPCRRAPSRAPAGSDPRPPPRLPARPATAEARP
jgi:hypothetical protein